MEFVYRNNTGDTFFDGINALGGNINCTSTQQVLMWDLRRLQVGGIRPYVGASAGGSYVDADFDFGGGLTGAISDFAFAYQGIAGIERQMSDRAAIFIEYRHFRTTELELEFQGNDYDVNYVANNLFFGFKFAR
jgi:opacity protein-like surface antigen